MLKIALDGALNALDVLLAAVPRTYRAQLTIVSPSGFSELFLLCPGAAYLQR